MKSWESYEDVARHILRQCSKEFGLSDVEGKQVLSGESGTKWEIEGKGIKEDDAGFVIIECRRYTKDRIKQESVGGLAFRIIDTGASGGIIVTPIGLQEGAEKVAHSRKIETLILHPESTTANYVARYLRKIMVRITETMTIRDEARVEVVRAKSSDNKAE